MTIGIDAYLDLRSKNIPLKNIPIGLSPCTHALLQPQ
jgi:hypothetical protein